MKPRSSIQSPWKYKRKERSERKMKKSRQIQWNVPLTCTKKNNVFKPVCSKKRSKLWLKQGLDKWHSNSRTKLGQNKPHLLHWSEYGIYKAPWITRPLLDLPRPANFSELVWNLQESESVYRQLLKPILEILNRAGISNIMSCWGEKKTWITSVGLGNYWAPKSWLRKPPIWRETPLLVSIICSPTPWIQKRKRGE